MKKLSGTSFGWPISSLAISAFIAVPMVFIIFSLLGPVDLAWQHLKETILPSYVGNTVLLMLQVALYTTIIGVSTAWLTAATQFPGRKIFSWALMLPLAAPAYIVAYVYTDLLDYSGPVQTAFRAITGLEGADYVFPQIRSLTGSALVLSLVLYPYVYMLARASFAQRSATLFDAARTLGAKPLKAFFKIALPAARPAIAAGLALVLMETLADFGVVEYFGVPTFSTGIFRTWFAMGEKAAAMKLAAVMFLFVAVLVILEKLNRKGTTQSAHARDAEMRRAPLSGWKAVGAFTVCALPVILGCIIPLAVLADLAITVGDPKLGVDFSEFTFNSISVAGMAVGVAVVAALMLTYAQRIAPTRTTATAIQISTLGYALPGAMLAIGLLAPLSQFDRWLAEFFETTLDWRSGLLLTGTVATLVYAYVVRFLTVAYNTTSSGLEQIPPIYDQAARSLGASPFRLVKEIHFPLMQRSVIAAAILVFVDTMRELPATLLLRPFNFETLATRVYRLAGDERLSEASTAAIAIVLIGLIPVLTLNKLTDKKH